MPSKPDLDGFIGATFRSVWALELLALLRRSRERAFSNADMVSELRASDLVVTRSVDELTAAGLVLVEADGTVRYGPASRALDDLADRTEAAYRRSPDAVRRLIVAAANPSLTAFADAFRLRKD